MKGFRSLVMAPLLLAASLGSALALDPRPSTDVSADQAVARLSAGNDRYTHARIRVKNFAKERHALAKEQYPYAIVVACSDSRVAPEILFDESLGKLFVIRVAGNVMDPVVLGSVEYAAEHLHTHLLVVLGHESCGAVKAALDGGNPPPNIGELTKRIAPAVERTKGQGIEAAVRENVKLQMGLALEGSPVLTEMTEKKELTIVGAEYHLESGQVEWLKEPADKK